LLASYYKQSKFIPKRTYLSSIHISGNNPEYAIITCREQLPRFSNVLQFSTSYRFVYHPSYANDIMIKSNLSDLGCYEYVSIRIFDEFEHHPIHNQIEIAKKHLAEYESLPLDTSGMDISYVKQVYDAYKKSSLFLSDLEALKQLKNKNAN